MQAISSIEELVEVLPHCSGTEFIDITKKLSLGPDDLEPFAHWDKDFYTRNCVSRNDDYELILLCWEPGQKTPIHCHNGEECWVYSVQGELEERRFKLIDEQKDQDDLKETRRAMMREGRVAYMNDEMGFHSLHNLSKERAMTLHLYVSPIDSCRIYNEEEECFVRKEMQYTSFEGNLLED